jgi:transposase-like protein
MSEEIKCPFCSSLDIYEQICVFGVDSWKQYYCDSCKKTFDDEDISNA